MEKASPYLSIEQIVEKYNFKAPTVRKWFFYRHKNGLSIAVRKIGGRVFVREDLFIEWIEQHKDN